MGRKRQFSEEDQKAKKKERNRIYQQKLKATRPVKTPKVKVPAKESYAKWRKNNIEKARQATRDSIKKLRKADPEKYRAKAKASYKKRYVNGSAFKLKACLRARLRYALIAQKVKKSDSAILLLGCTAVEACLYISSQFKPGMDWSNYGAVWEIDHIKPFAAFNLSVPEELVQANHYTNLQPLFVIDNRTKSDRWEGV